MLILSTLQFKVCTIKICGILLCTSMLVVFLLLHNIANEINEFEFIIPKTVKPAFGNIRTHSWKHSILRNHIIEHERLIKSLNKELLQTTEKRNNVQIQYEKFSTTLPKLKETIKEHELKIDEQKLRLREYANLRNVQLQLPHQPLVYVNRTSTDKKSCLPYKTFEDGLDYRRCSISKEFLFYLYPLAVDENKKHAQDIYNALMTMPSRTTNENLACLFVIVITNSSKITNYEYIRNTGHNHLIISLDKENAPKDFCNAMVVSSSFNKRNYRYGMDIVMFLHEKNSEASLPLLLPNERSILLYYKAGNNDFSTSETELFIETARSMLSTNDKSVLEIACTDPVNDSIMSLCGTKKSRAMDLQKAMFTLILIRGNNYYERLYEALETGSVPVILSLSVPLPAEEFIDWRLALIQLPFARLPELHFILRSISTSDYLELRRMGRIFFEEYFMNNEKAMQTVFSVMRHRLQMPVSNERVTKADPLFGTNYFAPNLITSFKTPSDNEKVGTIEVPVDSVSYTHNYTQFNLYAYKLWNKYPFLVENTPEYFMEDAIMPAEAELFEDTNNGMRPIAPGSGATFVEALGGNRQREQFTAIIQTYRRDDVLYSHLESLQNTPLLNKIIVIWNDVERQPPLTWPKLNVDIYWIKPKNNSLNNRFIPYSEIQTEAVLSLDDDMDLKQGEINIAFRIWREHRTQIVGFPARYHAHYNGSVFYNSNHTCQYSMILTGAAFFHKNWLLAYSQRLPKVVHEKVDELTNGEDIAFNFLVSHYTRLPPLKVTSKWTMRCPNCPDNLSNDAQHFEERHTCIRHFTQVFGYNPLVYTQYRADSVLFKTRVPQTHQKCYRYV